MALKTTAERLEEVQTAISVVLNSFQSYTISGRSFTRADLETLRKMERELQADLAREQAASRGGARARIRFRRV